MKKQFKLGVIGCGSVAQTILKGAVLSDFLHEKKIIVSDVSDERLEEIAFLGVRVAPDDKFVAENCDYLILAVNPRHFDRVSQNLKGCKPEKIISVMTGIKKNTIKNVFGSSTIKVARCVMNLPCSIGSGITGVDMNDFNSSVDDIEFISNLFSCLGEILSVNESKLDAVCGLSGSGPAYAFMFIDSLIDAGVKQGLTRNEATILTVKTILGSAEMVERGEKSVAELLMQICNNGGAAIEAVKSLESQNFRTIVSDAVDVCVKRHKEISDK